MDCVRRGLVEDAVHSDKIQSLCTFQEPGNWLAGTRNKESSAGKHITEAKVKESNNESPSGSAHLKNEGSRRLGSLGRKECTGRDREREST